jgi:hypothetical protein
VKGVSESGRVYVREKFCDYVYAIAFMFVCVRISDCLSMVLCVCAHICVCQCK